MCLLWLTVMTMMIWHLLPASAMLAIRSPEEESPETEEMDTSEPNWCWFYLAECGVWHMFEVSSSRHAPLSPLHTTRFGADVLSLWSSARQG